MPFGGGFAGAVGGATLGRAVVELVADSTRLRTDLSKAKKDVGTSTTAMEKRASAMSKAWQTAGLVAGAAIVAFGVSAVKAFKEAQQVTAQTEAVLKSTGGAANVTKGQVLDLAAAIRDYSGVSDEAVQSGANLLLTFTGIRNEVGKGNDIFNQTLASVVDVSVAMKMDMQSSAILVGKALNDPVKGMTALTRAGIQFTEQQKATIKSLVESGDKMGAQKVILGELDTQFEGSAKAAGDTFAGKLKILVSQFGDLQEAVGGFIVSGLSPLLSRFVSLPGPIKGVVAGVVGLTVAMVALAAVTKTVKNAFITLGLAQAGAGIAGLGAGLVAFATGPVALVAASLASLVLIIQNVDSAFKGVTESEAFKEKFGKVKEGADEAGASVAGLTKDVEGLAGEIQVFAGMTEEEFASWRTSTGESISGVTGLLQKLADKANLTAGDIIKAFTKLIRAQTNWGENLDTVRAKGAPDALLQKLSEMGLQGAQIIDVLADANKKDFDRIVASILRAMGITDQYIGKLDSIPRFVRTQIQVSAGDVPIGGAQHGFHGMVNRPSLFLTGEAGPERVDITPAAQMRRTGVSPQVALPAAHGGGGVTVNVYAPIYGDAVDTERWERRVEAAMTRAVSRFSGI